MTEDEKLILEIHRICCNGMTSMNKIIEIRSLIKEHVAKADADWIQSKLDADFERQKNLNDFEAGADD